jgi:hypothetical protein
MYSTINLLIINNIFKAMLRMDKRISKKDKLDRIEQVMNDVSITISLLKNSFKLLNLI